jgi:hypothetical protein
MSKKRARRRLTVELEAETVKLVTHSSRTMADIAMELRRLRQEVRALRSSRSGCCA